MRGLTKTDAWRRAKFCASVTACPPYNADGAAWDAIDGRARAGVYCRHGAMRASAFSWLAVFQVFAILASFQLSSVGHFVRDVGQLVTIGHHQHDDDDDEDVPGHECPAGCPNCHHVHSSSAGLPGAYVTAALGPVPIAAPPRPDVHDQAPPSPQLPWVYRPPRA